MTFSFTRERVLVGLVPPFLVALLAVPFVVRQNAWWEWTNALWLLELQTAHVAAHGVPTFFLHGAGEVFYPQHVFYGGFVMSVLAYPSVLLGAWPVFAAVTIAAPVMGFLGMRWTARNLGLSPRLAVLPALAFAFTPYLVTDLYGRGAWNELVAVNAVPLMLGGITALVWRADAARAPALAALAAGGALVAGTHNLTTLMAALLLPVIVLAALPAVPLAGSARAAAGRLAWGGGALALGVALTAAFLVPNVWVGPDTYIAQPAISEYLIGATTAFHRAGVTLAVWPTVPKALRGSTSVYAQAPTLALAWAVAAVVAGAPAWRRRPATGAAVVALLAVGAALTLLVVHPSWWLSFPRELQVVQFPFRLLPYVSIVGALLIAVALTAPHGARARRVLVGSLAAVVAFEGAAAGYVALHTPAAANKGMPVLHHGDLRAASVPATFGGTGLVQPYQFRVTQRPTSATLPTARVTASAADPAKADTATLSGVARAGEQRLTNVAWSPFVRVDGDARIVGRDAEGFAVVEVTRSAADGRFAATARARCGTCLKALTGQAPWQLLAGRALSLASALTLLALAAAALHRRRRVRGPRAERLIASPPS